MGGVREESVADLRLGCVAQMGGRAGAADRGETRVGKGRVGGDWWSGGATRGLRELPGFEHEVERERNKGKRND